MIRKMLKKWGGVLSSAAVALLIALPVSRLRGFAWGQAAAFNCRYLSDGFFVAGLLMTGLGALIWISTTGFFDIMSYGVRSLTVLFSSLKHPRDHKTYYDYKLERDAKRGKPRFSILLVGLASVALSALFLALYYNL